MGTHLCLGHTNNACSVKQGHTRIILGFKQEKQKYINIMLHGVLRWTSVLSRLNSPKVHSGRDIRAMVVLTRIEQ